MGFPGHTERGDEGIGSGRDRAIDVIQQIAKEFTTAFKQGDIGRGRSGSGEENRATTSLENFKKLSPPVFNGTSGPELVES